MKNGSLGGSIFLLLKAGATLWTLDRFYHTYISHKLMVNVGKSSIHGARGKSTKW